MSESELITLFGQTNGTATTGTVSLNSDILYQSVNAIVIPQGMKAKIYVTEISGAAVSFTVNYSTNILAASPTLVPVASYNLANAGQLIVDIRRPIILRSRTGQEGFNITWSQSTAAVSNITIVVEFTPD